MFQSVITDRDLSEKEMELRCGYGNCKVILWKNDLLHDINGDIAGIVSIGTDITERRDMENRLEQIAYYDSLTGLPNRAYLEEVATTAIERNNKFAIINLDIDDFKHINETMGHSVGDTFIQYIGDVLASVTAEPDVVVRVSGDQFALLISQADNDDTKIEEHAECILQEIRKPWNMNGQQLFLTASLGVSVYPEHGIDFTTLMQNADIAMFHQKDIGKDGYSIFEETMFQKTLKFVQMGNQLRTAIENQEFLLYYQPQYDLKSGRILGAEALIRWFHPEKGFIPPMEFIPYSEKTGYIIPISEWVLKSAILQKREWDRKGYPPIKIAINLSGYTFTESAVFENICSILREMEVRPGEIEIEVTETAVMMELDKAKACLQRLKEFGITIAMDDFGTGYSSLNYLQMLPFDILKIDREFIKNIDQTKECYIYKTVVELAHNMELTVVAEGIETKEQEEFLQRNHCDIGQGYYFCKPVPANELENILKDNKELNREIYV
ncbi:MAG TPA: EAL domain-containing protein [Lachnospiraceae bacterium]|nr:EAL domain-containing protein [Lachnospiraceae bacterium]